MWILVSAVHLHSLSISSCGSSLFLFLFSFRCNLFFSFCMGLPLTFCSFIIVTIAFYSNLALFFGWSDRLEDRLFIRCKRKPLVKWAARRFIAVVRGLLEGSLKQGPENWTSWAFLDRFFKGKKEIFRRKTSFPKFNLEVWAKQIRVCFRHVPLPVTWFAVFPVFHCRGVWRNALLWNGMSSQECAISDVIRFFWGVDFFQRSLLPLLTEMSDVLRTEDWFRFITYSVLFLISFRSTSLCLIVVLCY